MTDAFLKESEALTFPRTTEKEKLTHSSAKEMAFNRYNAPFDILGKRTAKDESRDDNKDSPTAKTLNINNNIGLICFILQI